MLFCYCIVARALNCTKIAQKQCFPLCLLTNSFWQDQDFIFSFSFWVTKRFDKCDMAKNILMHYDHNRVQKDGWILSISENLCPTQPVKIYSSKINSKNSNLCLDFICQTVCPFVEVHSLLGKSIQNGRLRAKLGRYFCFCFVFIITFEFARIDLIANRCNILSKGSPLADNSLFSTVRILRDT